MPTTAPHHVLAIEQLTCEWRTLGRSGPATGALHKLADRDPALAALVYDDGPAGPPARCPTPHDLIEHMRQATGRHQRELAASYVSIMLREAKVDPLVPRILLQALIPGLFSIAAKLRWGRGGDWEDGNAFFTELVSVTWEVLRDWSGQDRPYAVLDILSATRCRVRRQLFRSRDQQNLHVPLSSAHTQGAATASETDLELLARRLIELRQEGMRSEDVEVLYAHHVMGYSIAELAVASGRDRRVLYARRDRGHRRMYAGG
ncbi:MAG TPA: hypothetical protein VHV57_17025 [Acidimicrobiales bacterium]|jgi:hypothetical protein|nr:hypothetical protein [Acidimicrobiales bacterium]